MKKEKKDFLHVRCTQKMSVSILAVSTVAKTLKPNCLGLRRGPSIWQFVTKASLLASLGLIHSINTIRVELIFLLRETDDKCKKSIISIKGDKWSWQPLIYFLPLCLPILI